MASAHKPLPELPNLSADAPVAALTVDARAHLRAFLRFALREEGLRRPDAPDDENEREGNSWEAELERALDEFGTHLAAGRWLARARTHRRTWEVRHYRHLFC